MLQIGIHGVYHSPLFLWEGKTVSSIARERMKCVSTSEECILQKAKKDW